MSELHTKIELINTKLSDYIEFQDKYRDLREKRETEILQTQEDRFKILTTQIETINKFNFRTIPDYTLMKQHIKDSESIKSIWRERSFKIILAMVAPVYLTLLGIVVKLMTR